MAQTEIVKYNLKLGRGTTANERVLAAVGGTVTAILNSDDGSYQTADLVLTHVDHDRQEYGWSRAVSNYRSQDIKRFHHKHTMLCP